MVAVGLVDVFDLYFHENGSNYDKKIRGLDLEHLFNALEEGFVFLVGYGLQAFFIFPFLHCLFDLGAWALGRPNIHMDQLISLSVALQGRQSFFLQPEDLTALCAPASLLIKPYRFQMAYPVSSCSV